MSSVKKAVSMTEGSVYKSFISFMIPMIGGNIFNNLYNIADTIIVGQYLGQDALAAVGAAGLLVALATCLSIGLVQGCNIIIAQEFGKKDMNSIRKHLAHSIVISAVVLTVIMTIFISFNGVFLDWLNTIPELYTMIYEYQLIVYFGLPFVFIFQLAALIFQNMGDSKTTVYFMILSAVLNVVFNFLFIAVFQWGTNSVAYATVLAQIISALGLLFLALKRYKEIYLSKEDFNISKVITKRIILMGIPVALQGAIIQVGGVFTQSAMNNYDPTYLAGSTVVGKISSLVMLVYIAIGSTVSIFIGQNYGARNMERMKEGIKVANIIATIYSVFALITAILLFEPMVVMFVGSDLTPELMDACRMFFFSVCWFLPLLGVLEVYRSAVRGLGRTFVTMISSCTEVVGKIIVIFIFGAIYGVSAIAFANPISWIFTLIPVIPCYIVVMKKINKFGFN